MVLWMSYWSVERHKYIGYKCGVIVVGSHYWCHRMHRATQVMEHNINLFLALIGGMIASCRTFPILGNDISMIVDPNKGEFGHGIK